MAFETVSGGKKKFMKATDMQVGEKLVGYLMGAVESTGFPGKFDLKLRLIDGQDVILSTSGSLKYFALDLNAGKREQAMCLSHLIQITRLESYKNKRQQTVSAFQVDRDPNKTLDQSTFQAAQMDDAVAIKEDRTDEIPF